jgi:hypothetical protein
MKLFVITVKKAVIRHHVSTYFFTAFFTGLCAPKWVQGVWPNMFIKRRCSIRHRVSTYFFTAFFTVLPNSFTIKASFNRHTGTNALGYCWRVQQLGEQIYLIPWKKNWPILHVLLQYLQSRNFQDIGCVNQLLKIVDLFIFLFCTMTKKCTIISQIIILLHVSTLSCHPQGTCNHYLTKLHKYFKCSCW